MKETRKNYLKKYNDEHKEEHHKWYLDHIEYRRQYMKEYREKNKEKLKLKKQLEYQEKKKTYYIDKNYKSKVLVDNYKYNDKHKGRGECTLTADWIVENIFSGQKCVYCGESDWKKLGCDRIDNSKPHTPENVVCSCWNCNNARGEMSFEDFIKYKKDLE